MQARAFSELAVLSIDKNLKAVDYPIVAEAMRLHGTDRVYFIEHGTRCLLGMVSTEVILSTHPKRHSSGLARHMKTSYSRILFVRRG